jgi:hypothetical protein
VLLAEFKEIIFRKLWTRPHNYPLQCREIQCQWECCYHLLNYPSINYRTAIRNRDRKGVATHPLLNRDQLSPSR